jgi:hypothetical protein
VGEATGTTAWSIPSVAVPLGTTVVVTVTAYDNSGNTSSVALTIVNADTIKPTVKIYTPTTASSMTTTGSTVTLAGTASDNVGVTDVTWATDRGASGAAFGGSSWSTPSLAIGGGTTVITVTARDAAGNTGVSTLTVTSAATKADSNSNKSSKAPTNATTTTSNVTNETVQSSVAATGYDNGPVPPKVPSPAPSASAPPMSAPALPTSATTSAPAPSAPQASAASSSKSDAPAAPPVVRIIAPTTAVRFTTTASALTLAGIASHASGISVVRWTTDKGDGGVAEGTSKWTIPQVATKPGTTVITVTAASGDGDITNATLTVVRPEPLPKLSITSPTADSQWISGTGTVALKGSATDNVTRVTWSSDSGAAGVAQGTTSWAITGIGLQAGVNRITVTAQDGNGRTDRHVLTVTYRPGPK